MPENLSFRIQQISPYPKSRTSGNKYENFVSKTKNRTDDPRDTAA